MAKSFTYYFEQLRKIEEHRTKTAEVELRRMYKRLLKDTKAFVAEEYYQLAQDGKLTYEILRAKGREARLLEEAEQRLNDLSPAVSKEIKKTVEEIYTMAYNGMVDAVQKSATSEELKKNLKGLRGISPQTVKANVENPIAGLTLKDTLEKNRQSIIWNIKREIGVGLTNGDRYETMAKRIAVSLDGDYKKAVRIVRTEAGRAIEAGHLASAKEINGVLDEGSTDYRLAKTWKSMRDGKVRDDHQEMNDITVAMEEVFILPDGTPTEAPKQSGVARQDINCRCFVKYSLMNEEEFQKAAGKARPASSKQKQIKKFEQQEADIIDQKTNLLTEADDHKKQMSDLESRQYVNIWKDPVTVKDYDTLQGKVQAKRDYFLDQLSKDGSTKWKSLLSDLDDFEINGQEYLKLKNKLEASTAQIKVLDDDLKDVRQKLMKAKGINPDKIKEEIDDLQSQLAEAKVSPLQKIKVNMKDVGEITAEDYLSGAATKKAQDAYEKAMKIKAESPKYGLPVPASINKEVADFEEFLDEIKKLTDKSGIDINDIIGVGSNVSPLQSKVKDVDPDAIKKAIKDTFGKTYPDDLIKDTIENWADDSLEKMVDDLFVGKDKDAIKEALEKTLGGNTKKITLKTKVKDCDPNMIKAALDDAMPGITDEEMLKDIMDAWSDDSVDSLFKNLLFGDEQEVAIKSFEKATGKAAAKSLDDIVNHDYYVIDHDATGKDYLLNINGIKDDMQFDYKAYKKKVADKLAENPDYNGIFAKKLKALEDFFEEVEEASGSFKAFETIKAANAVDPKKVANLEKLLQDKKDEFEAVVKRYGLDDNMYGLIDDVYSESRKNAAYWFTDANGSVKAADKVLRDKSGEVWRNATKNEQNWIYEYTRSYHKYNEPLRGIEYGTNKFLGVGNVDMDDIGVSTGYGFKKGQIKSQIDDITSIINKSSYDFDIWVQRGCRRMGMDKFFGIDLDDFNLPEDKLAEKLVGTTPTEFAFMSTGVAKGKGLNTSGGILLNIYAPSGTKMMYLEPFSAFGNGSGKSWDGIAKQSSFGHEAEMLIQRGTRFRVTKVEKGNGTIYIDMEIIGQEAN